MKLSKRHFWEWFKRNNKEYLTLNKKSKKEARYWLQELNAHVRAYFKFFGFSLLLPDKGIARLTITVKGRARYFKKADAFVATAPSIPGWSIQSLEDPLSADLLVATQIATAGIDPWEFRFSFSGDQVDQPAIVTMYHPLYTEDNECVFLGIAYETVYHVLGERSFGMDIGHLEVANLSCADPEEVYPLEELAAQIGWRSASLSVDHDGNLMSIRV